ncbi:hypothetical protein NW752_009197 [Fusarium irregulare]|nr:hypothetical protein NW752_009197 [Fusarium irregulare]
MTVPVTQCQDGRLIGDDDETSTPSETIPQDTATPSSTVTSGIEDATTVKVSRSSSYFPTQSELISNSHTSDAGASNIVSSDTTITDITITGITITDNTITDTTSTDTTNIDTNMMDTTTSDVPVTDTSMDTASLPSSTIVVDIATGDTTHITTTAASTATVEPSTTSSGAPDIACTNTNNPYTASNGVTFALTCNTYINAALLQDPYLSDFFSCMQACSKIQACVGVSSYRVSSTGSDCWLWSSFDVGSAQDDESWDVAIKDPVIADTTTAATGAETTDTSTAGTITTDVPAGDTTTSAVPTETSGLPTCGDLSNPVQVDDDTYDIFCGIYRLFFDATVIGIASFLDCIQACSQSNNCVGVIYQEDGGICYLGPEVFGDFFIDDGLSFAFRQGA